MFKLNYVENGDYKIKIKENQWEQYHNIKQIAKLIGMITEEFDLQPELYELEEEMAIGVLYNNTCVDLEHFLDEYGQLFSAISSKNVVSIQGEVDGLEEGKIVTTIEKETIVFKKYNTTGRDFDLLRSIYIKVYLNQSIECKFVWSMLEKMAYHSQHIVMEREWDKLECAKDLYEKYPLLYFRYINLTNEKDTEDSYFAMINALGINQIMVLWEKYLEENVVYEEFERVCEMYEKGYDVSIFKWGIGLNRVVRKNGIKVNIGNDNVCSILDREGKQIRMGYNSISGAEKLFIKFLFPNK